MRVCFTSTQLNEFEEDIADCFNKGLIKAPIHLESGNEEHLIKVFSEYVNDDDWLLCSWRSHLKCLLKGVPPEKLKEEILAGHSMGLCFPEQKILSSAIVGGICPIALGLAMGISLRGEKNKVVCFIGDMTSESGIFAECQKYAENFELPVLWVIEDNNRSTNTPTNEAWGLAEWSTEEDIFQEIDDGIIWYRYKSKWPHSGTGNFILF